ncbi:phosphatase [Clostridium sporogenes]|uniref:Phosphatase n=2 Tax=Clostridium TaxID=1485 RepID=A0A6M0SUH5_CLOBO|nr:phosphatase [Clostridium sporogenes]NFA59157.1 phosphatase [Clostridium botulinum]MDS1004538.1 phosphatase [Clostridium sporogenes]NFI74764.1 phosphatase [Clostridium sporogenes]NFL71103.1 phosphatase [Clostridium sporogenes]NFM24505.1 phosphatase [Clostridium sporogenes]
MKYLVDTHTHTIVSGHAYTTFLENVQEASNIGLKVLGTTDHGPSMPGGPNLFYFNNFKVMPRKLKGVTLLHGCEANIIDFKGMLDIPDFTQKKLDVIIASLHDVCIRPGSREENTEALINVMENPYVDMLGHIGNPSFPINEEAVIKKAKEKNVLIEINNGSFVSRKGCEETCKKVANLCKKHKVNIIVGSDSHVCFQIGRFPKADKMLEEVGMPEELVMNNEENKILKYLKNKGKLKDLNLD